MEDRSNSALNEAIEEHIRIWRDTIHGYCIKNMYGNGDSYEHVCEAAGIDIDDYEEG